MISIASHENKTLKLIRSLQRKKGRSESGLYFAEGLRIAEEALRFARQEIKCLIVSDVFAEKNKNFVNKLDETGKTVYTAKERLFQDVCNTETPQGIGVVLHMPEPVQPRWENMRFVLVLDGVSEPGNLGTIVRTAEAAGVDCVCLLKGCADLYNPKTVRSTMGSIFRMQFMTGAESQVLEDMKACGFTVAATALRDSVVIGEAKIPGRCALVIGSEAAGVSESVLQAADLRVRIPMEGKVESLNAAVAAGIAMYLLKP